MYIRFCYVYDTEAYSIRTQACECNPRLATHGAAGPNGIISIFSTVTITRIGTFITISEGLEFISRLLKTFLVGFAIATAVSLLVLPITSGSYVFQDMRDYAEQVQNVLQCQISFLKGTSTSTV